MLSRQKFTEEHYERMNSDKNFDSETYLISTQSVGSQVSLQGCFYKQVFFQMTTFYFTFKNGFKKTLIKISF